MYLVKFSIFWRLFGHFWISLTRLWVPRCPKMNSPVQGEYFWYRGRENRPTRKKDRSVWKPVFKSNLTPHSSWSREMTFHFWRQKKRSWYVSIKFFNSKRTEKFSTIFSIEKWLKIFRNFFNTKKWLKIFRIFFNSKKWLKIFRIFFNSKKWLKNFRKILRHFSLLKILHPHEEGRGQSKKF